MFTASSADKETKDKPKEKVLDKESKSDLNGKTPSESSTSSRSSSPGLNSKCEPTTPKDNKVLSFPASKPSANAIREKCREMMVNSLQTDDDEIKSGKLIRSTCVLYNKINDQLCCCIKLVSQFES